MAGWHIGELYPLDEAEGDRWIQAAVAFAREWHESERGRITCLLYTSDAADERSSVDLGGRRIIKKKQRESLSHRAK